MSFQYPVKNGMRHSVVADLCSRIEYSGDYETTRMLVKSIVTMD